MHSAWDEVQPNQIYRVTKSFPLSEEGNKGLIYLYQPIIGAQALTLYYGLLGDKEDLYENEFVHIDILDALNIGLPAFLAARKQLEGMGLLSVFVKDDEEFGRMFLYRLEEPLHPEKFFKDETYSFLLLNTVGERKFNQIVHRFQPEVPDLSAYQEITRNFRQVYGPLDEPRFIQKAGELEQIAHHYQSASKGQLSLDESQLDWDFLIDLAQRKFISAENFTPEFKKQLILYANLFGYDELALIDLMTETVSLSNGQIDTKELDKLIMQHHSKITKKTISADSDSEAEIRRFNRLRQTGFSDKDIELIKEVQNIAPMDYLNSIKNQKKSYVTNQDSWALKDLVEQSPLPNSVINILVHYVLIIKNMKVLKKTFVEPIAADWSELEIKTPEEAIQHVRQLVNEAKEKKNQRPAYQKGNRKPIRKEKLPDWVNQKQEEVEDAAKQAAIDERLKKYLKRKEGEK